MCSNKLQLIPNATLYHFGVLESNVHMAWMRAVCGRLKSDYDYSAKIVHNNFPWRNPTDAQRAKIENTAQAILDARALYPDGEAVSLHDGAVVVLMGFAEFGRHGGFVVQVRKEASASRN